MFDPFSWLRRRSMDRIQRTEELCRQLDGVFNEITALLRPGVTTLELDRAAERAILARGCSPLFQLNPNNPFPATITTSVNDEVVNGVPTARPLIQGDLLSLQIGVQWEGVFAYQAWTFPIGEISPTDSLLIRSALAALSNGISAVRADGQVSIVSGAIEATLEQNGFSPGREFVGHGIADQLHVEPAIPCYVSRRSVETTFKAGQLLSIHVFAHAGSPHTRTEKDGWTVVTRDGSRAVNFSHLVVVERSGYRVITSKRGQ
jgi:methionyl aminopeptidase